MGLPIAVGGKALSSRPVAPPSPIPEDAADGSAVLSPFVLECPPRLAFTTSQDQKLSAVCSISYYDMMRVETGERETVMVEMRVQVSPLSQAFSTRYRDVLHRIPFPIMKKKEQDNVEDDTTDFVPLSPSLVFSSDGRNLACLVPHPRQTSSMLVIFQLRKPRTSSVVTLPRPSYLGPAPTPHLVRVATNPQVAKLPNDTPLLKASAICNVQAHSGSLLLGGCVDGSIIVIAYRPAQVAGILHQGDAMFTSLSHRTDGHDEQDGSRGKLVAVEQNGTAILFSSHLVVSETSNMLLMQLQKRFELRESSFVKAVWMGPAFLALLVKPSVQSSAAAQVWPIPNGDDDEPSEPVATLIMSTERLNEYAHGSFSLESAAPQETNTDASYQVETLETATCLQYDKESGCLAVSSFVMAVHALAKPFACIWHWRTNVVGLMLTTRSQQVLLERDNAAIWQVPIYSALYFAYDYHGGKLLAHILSDTAREWKSQHQNRIRKEVYNLALLSPSETMNGSGCEQPSSLMVSSKCVTFPSVSNPFSAKDCEFVWKDARIPTSYTTAFGAPRLACIGRKRCRSIAVAGTKGMCVLDCSRQGFISSGQFTLQSQGSKPNTKAILSEGAKSARFDPPKWRLFGNEADERTFRVLAMTWWEGSTDRKSGGSDVHSDDLLVAVITVQGESKEKKDDLLYLACWSPRRLDQANQMMVRWRNMAKGRTSSSWGIRLPAGFEPSSISLLSEPLAAGTESTDGVSAKRRAVILLSDDFLKDKSGNISYQLYQLEMGFDGTYQDTEETKFVVKAKLCSDGTLLAPSPAFEATVSGVFLASASFDFQNAVSKSSRNVVVDANGDGPGSAMRKTFLAAVGIIRSPCEGLEAVLISTHGVCARKDVITGYSSEFFVWCSPEVSTYWHSYTIPAMNKSKRVESFFVWSIELCDGTLMCWSVPYIGALPSKILDETEHASNLTNGGTNPLTALNEHGENKQHQSLFGSITSIGESSSWIQEISVANRTGFSVGSIPSTPFGCILRCSQSGKGLHRFVPIATEDHGSAKDVDHEIFCLGSTELAPPSLVPSLYASLVGRVEKVGSDPYDSHVSYMVDFSSKSVNAYTMLNSIANEDTALLALRTLINRIIELIVKESDKMGNDISAQHSLFLLTTTFADIVEAAKERLPPMQFVSLFLGIGRQIEPSYLPHLFPLPLSTSMAGDRQHHCRSVEDLFLYSVRHGSISVASSALPLFSSKRYSLKMCGSLLRHCLETVTENADSQLSVAFDLSAEERRMLRGVFNFGVRIEDSGTMPPMEPLDDNDPLLVTRSRQNSVDVTDHSFDSVASADTPGGLHGQLLATQQRSSRICQLFSSSSFFGQFQRPKEEDAIFDAASSFILSGFDEVKIGFESPSIGKSSGSRRTLTGDGSVSSATSESGEITMAGIIASFLLPLAFPTDTAKQKFRWKRTATLAQVLVGENSSDFDASAGAKIRAMTTLAESWSLDGIIFSLQISNSSLNNGFGSAEKEKWLVRLLKRHLTECGMMMSTAHATTVLRLVIVLLDRYSFGRDIKARSPGLLLLGIIVAHCAGYKKELLDARPRNKFTSSYVAALNEMRHR